MDENFSNLAGDIKLQIQEGEQISKRIHSNPHQDTLSSNSEK